MRRLLVVTLAALCALSLSSCANTLQEKPIPHNLLEDLIMAPFPVYWLGGNFHGLPVSEASHDPSGAYTVQYGNCVAGGEGGCVAQLRVITSPDNSFLPGGGTPKRTARLRGLSAIVTRTGNTIVVPTGAVVVDIYASNPRTAAIAAQTIVPINAVGSPEARLAAPLPNTGFGEKPLASQLPRPLHPLGSS